MGRPIAPYRHGTLRCGRSKIRAMHFVAFIVLMLRVVMLFHPLHSGALIIWSTGLMVDIIGHSQLLA